MNESEEKVRLAALTAIRRATGGWHVRKRGKGEEQVANDIVLSTVDRDLLSKSQLREKIQNANREWRAGGGHSLGKCWPGFS